MVNSCEQFKFCFSLLRMTLESKQKTTMKVEREITEKRKTFVILVPFNGNLLLLLEQGALYFHFALNSASYVAGSVYHSKTERKLQYSRQSTGDFQFLPFSSTAVIVVCYSYFHFLRQEHHCFVEENNMPC